MQKAAPTNATVVRINGCSSKRGTGVAVVNGRRHPLKAGSLVLIERGDVHEICNTPSSPQSTWST
jgi:hypothetical protein